MVESCVRRLCSQGSLRREIANTDERIEAAISALFPRACCDPDNRQDIVRQPQILSVSTPFSKPCDSSKGQKSRFNSSVTRRLVTDQTYDTETIGEIYASAAGSQRVGASSFGLDVSKKSALWF